jgi:hypothetical protein
MPVSVTTSFSVRDIACDIRGWERMTAARALARGMSQIRSLGVFNGGFPAADSVQQAYDDADLNRAVAMCRLFFSWVSGKAICSIFTTPSGDSFELHFGPEPPDGSEHRWVRTIPGRGWSCTSASTDQRLRPSTAPRNFPTSNAHICVLLRRLAETPQRPNGFVRRYLLRPEEVGAVGRLPVTSRRLRGGRSMDRSARVVTRRDGHVSDVLPRRRCAAEVGNTPASRRRHRGNHHVVLLALWAVEHEAAALVRRARGVVEE